MAAPNSLGLDFDQLKIQNPEEPPSPQPVVLSPLDDASSQPEQGVTPEGPLPQTREKKQPYVNTERVKTGGSHRDKLSEEALAERMARMKTQNEKIKQRRMDVQADEEAFRKTQKLERAKIAQTRRVQENVDRTREQNAKRKLDKIQSREWDSGKPAGEWKHQQRKDDNASLPAAEGNRVVSPTTTSPSRAAVGVSRGNYRGNTQRNIGRGRGRGSSIPSTSTPASTSTQPSLKTEFSDSPTAQDTASAEAPKEMT